MNNNKRWVKETDLVIYDVNKALPPAPIPSQVLGYGNKKTHYNYSKCPLQYAKISTTTSLN